MTRNSKKKGTRNANRKSEHILDDATTTVAGGDVVPSSNAPAADPWAAFIKLKDIIQSMGEGAAIPKPEFRTKALALCDVFEPILKQHGTEKHEACNTTLTDCDLRDIREIVHEEHARLFAALSSRMTYLLGGGASDDGEVSSESPLTSETSDEKV
jgi:hypothetical protein